jgi:hypothetical protein
MYWVLIAAACYAGCGPGDLHAELRMWPLPSRAACHAAGALYRAQMESLGRQVQGYRCVEAGDA